MKLAEIIDAFNENLAKEYGAVLLYIELRKLPIMAKNVKIAALLSHLAEDEMRHAEMLADNIANLGGKSTWKIAPFDRITSVKAALTQIIKCEEQAIEDYGRLLENLDGQPKLQEMLVSILDDEKHHKKKTEEIMKMIIGRKKSQ